MRRREFILTIGASAIASSRAAQAQQRERVRRIGVLMSILADDPEAGRRVASLREGLKRAGWTEGANVHIDFRWTGGKRELAKAYADELAKLAPDVVLVWGTPVLKAVRAASPQVPVVFVAVVDPVGQGFVSSLAHPGGNVTGFANYDLDIGGKWLDLLKEATPGLERLVVVSDPRSSGGEAEVRSIEAAASARSTRLNIIPGRDAAQLEADLDLALREPATGLLVLPGPFNAVHRELLVRMANDRRVPAVYPYRYFPASGGLMSYGIDLVAQVRQAASYLSRILKGEKPGDLPVQQATDFEFVVNLKTAKQLGINLPPTFVARADEVIE